MAGNVSIKDLDKAAVLAALYNRARPMGMGFMHFIPGDMTLEEARKFLTVGDDGTQMFKGSGRPFYFDYLMGRCLKVDLNGDELDPCGYDRDYGEGAAEKVIAALRKVYGDLPIHG